MRKIYCFLLFTLLLSAGNTMFGQPPAPLSVRDVTEVKALAEKQIELDLARLYRVLTFAEVSYKERKALVETSYQPGPSQLFLNENVLVEDDIDPAHTDTGDPKNIISRFVGVYLHGFALRSVPNSAESVRFTAIKAGPVEWNNRRWEVQVTFTSLFGGTYKPTGTPYKPVERVATLWADKSSGKWALQITQLGFVRGQSAATPQPAANAQTPGAGQTQSSAFFDPTAISNDGSTATAPPAGTGKPNKSGRKPKATGSRPAAKPQPARPTGAKPTAKPVPTKD
jgi:hypothetical protein